MWYAVGMEKTKRKLSDREREIVAAYRRHGTLAAAGEALGISPQRVHQVVQRAGASRTRGPRRRKRPAGWPRRLERLIRSRGETTAAFAAVVGVCPRTIQNYLAGRTEVSAPVRRVVELLEAE